MDVPDVAVVAAGVEVGLEVDSPPNRLGAAVDVEAGAVVAAGLPNKLDPLVLDGAAVVLAGAFEKSDGVCDGAEAAVDVFVDADVVAGNKEGVDAGAELLAVVEPREGKRLEAVVAEVVAAVVAAVLAGAVVAAGLAPPKREGVPAPAPGSASFGADAAPPKRLGVEVEAPPEGAPNESPPGFGAAAEVGAEGPPKRLDPEVLASG